MSQVVIGEAVPLDLRVARLGSRTVAAALDLAIEAVVFLIVVLAWANSGLITDADIAAAGFLVLYVLFTIGYPVAFESLWRGRTPGKAALGLRVVRDDGGPIRFRHAFVRGALNLLERPGFTFGLAAVVASLASRRGKRVGDLLAGTVVLQERVPRQRAAPIDMPPPLAGWATMLDLTRLSDDLALAARDFLHRSHELRPQAREQLGTRLTAAVVAAISPPPPPGAPGWAVLAAVLAERRRRDALRLAAEHSGGLIRTGGTPPAWGSPGPTGPSGPAAAGAGAAPAAVPPRPPQPSAERPPDGPFAPPA